MRETPSLVLSRMLHHLVSLIQQDELEQAVETFLEIGNFIYAEHVGDVELVQQFAAFVKEQGPEFEAALQKLKRMAFPETKPASPLESLDESGDARGMSLDDGESRPRDWKRAKPPEKGELFPVWFGTNRKPDKTAAGGFGSERHDRTTLGRALVFIPETHRFGETGTPFWKRLLKLDLRDDHLKLQEVSEREREAFFAEIQAAMKAAKEGGETPHALFFLHGFNVSFEEAAIQAAQMGCDLNVPGATAFFSWPSRGNVAAYTADEASIEASERAITEFLVDFARNSGAEKIHIVAHSMGNRGLLRALQRIASNAETQGKVKFGQIFLAAPDVDRDVFLDLASLYAQHSERTTLYASDGDLPLYLSGKLHDAPRAGYFKPYTVVPGVDTVAVPNFDLDLLGHSYIAKAEALLHDLFDLMRHGEPPTKRQRLQSVTEDGVSFWKLLL